MRLAAALCLALVPAPLWAFTPESAALMVDAIRAQDCALSGERADEVLGPLGLEPIEVQAIVDTLYGAGLFALSDDALILSLTPDLCAAEGEGALALITAAFEAQESDLARWQPDFPPESGAELIAVVRGLGCAMTTDQAAETLPPLGFDPVLTRDIVSVMVETGNATLNDDRSALSLSPALCAADAAGDLAAMQAMIDQWLAENADTEGNQTGGDE